MVCHLEEFVACFDDDLVSPVWCRHFGSGQPTIFDSFVNHANVENSIYCVEWLRMWLQYFSLFCNHQISISIPLFKWFKRVPVSVSSSFCLFGLLLLLLLHAFGFCLNNRNRWFFIAIIRICCYLLAVRGWNNCIECQLISWKNGPQVRRDAPSLAPPHFFLCLTQNTPARYGRSIVVQQQIYKRNYCCHFSIHYNGSSKSIVSW